MLRRHFFLVAALAVMVAMLVTGGLKLAAAKSTQDPAPAAANPAPGGPKAGGGQPVSVVRVAAHDFVDELEVLGVAKGRQSVTLTAAATQLVERVRFTDGQSVSRGAVLVELKETEQNAGLAQAQARLEQAKRAYDRWRALGDKGFASHASIEEYQAAYRSAQADVAAAEARRSDRMIRAPFAGVVGLSDVAPGALVNPGSPIVTLDDISAIRVDFPVPEQFLSQLHEGQAIQAHADAYPGRVIAGRIARLDTRVDERTRAITARAEFPNPDRLLKPGMLIRVAIRRGARQAAAAPESAVAVSGETAYVFLVREDGGRTITEQRPVTTGLRQAGLVELRDGAAVGDSLVADGLNKIQAGQPVKVAGPPPGPAA